MRKIPGETSFKNGKYFFTRFSSTKTTPASDYGKKSKLTHILFTAPLVDIVNGTSFIAMRSIISKLVPPDELGE